MNNHTSERVRPAGFERRWGGMRAEYGWLLLGCVAVLGIGILAFGSAPRDRDADRRGPLALGTSMRGVRTSVFDHDRLRVRASASEVKVAQPRVLGPIRVGFLRAITASDVTIETFPRDQASAHGASAAAEVESALSSFVSRQARDAIARVDLHRVKIVERRSAESAVELAARSCSTAAGRGRLVCRAGVFRDQTREMAFEEAEYGEGGWTVTEAPRAP